MISILSNKRNISILTKLKVTLNNFRKIDILNKITKSKKLTNIRIISPKEHHLMDR